MLYIDLALPHIITAKNNHEKIIFCYLNRKIFGNNKTLVCSDQSCIICNSKIQKAKSTSQLLINVLKQLNLREIAGGLPQNLKYQSDKFFRLYSNGNNGSKVLSEKDKDSINKIFSYDWFEDKKNDIYGAYELCTNLKLESCVYCNRLYTSTVIIQNNKKIIRPTLDHWFSQSRYPILALSFYNLIPSCSSCNSSVKHNSPFSLKNNYHPYLQTDITSKYIFDYSYSKSLNNFKISIKTKDNKIQKTLDEMRIAEIYSHHQSEIADLDLLKRKYNRQCLKDLGKLLNKNFSDKDVYRILFGVEYDDSEFYKRPLSKFKKDILNLKLK